jgi:hypothetical protein
MKHKHHNEIIAWANGAEIEFRAHPALDWCPCHKNKPDWLEHVEYRVKPTPKPDVWQWLFVGIDVNNDLYTESNKCSANIKLTFDGETRKLKAAEVIE